MEEEEEEEGDSFINANTKTRDPLAKKKWEDSSLYVLYNTSNIAGDTLLYPENYSYHSTSFLLFHYGKTILFYSFFASCNIHIQKHNQERRSINVLVQ